MSFQISNSDELVKSRKTSFFVIPAPHQVRDKLQPCLWQTSRARSEALALSSLFNYLRRLWTPACLPQARFSPEWRLFTKPSTLTLYIFHYYKNAQNTRKKTGRQSRLQCASVIVHRPLRSRRRGRRDCFLLLSVERTESNKNRPLWGIPQHLVMVRPWIIVHLR